MTTVPTALAHNTCTSGSACNLSEYLNPALQGGSIYQAYDPNQIQMVSLGVRCSRIT